MQESVSPTGRIRRGGPGLPLEMADPDDEDLSGPDWGGPGTKRKDANASRGRWWRPASKAGRLFLTLGALTVLGTLSAGVIFLKAYLEHDARFRIAGSSNIETSGLVQVSRADMLPVFGEDMGRNVFFVPLQQRRRELEAIPWVERATVMRILPDQLRVQIVERKPVAFVREGQQIGLVDANGVLLSMPAATMARQHYSFPVVTGIDPGDSLSSRAARMAVYLRPMGELDANHQQNSAQISEIDLTDPEDARVLMPEQGADILAHFGEDHFMERFQRYKAHIAEWRQQYPHLAAVDLRYDQQVVLQMKPGTGAADATVGDPAATGADARKPNPGAPAAQRQTNGEHDGKDAAAKKKRAPARRSALNLSRREPSAPAHPLESD
jgi:cell division protein FtsQ